MTLPATVARCPGQNTSTDPAAAWPFPREQQDCLSCERRRQGIADYMAGEKVEWMRAPSETLCPEALPRKEKRNA